jgi:hypothetical protein
VVVLEECERSRSGVVDSTMRRGSTGPVRGNSTLIREKLRGVLETFTNATFEPHVGEAFLLHEGSGPPVEVVLVEATVLATLSSSEARAPFSIVFRQASGAFLQQGMYGVEHSTVGGLRPLPGADRSGRRRDAVRGGIHLTAREIRV